MHYSTEPMRQIGRIRVGDMVFFQFMDMDDATHICYIDEELGDYHLYLYTDNNGAMQDDAKEYVGGWYTDTVGNWELRACGYHSTVLFAPNTNDLCKAELMYAKHRYQTWQSKEKSVS